MYDTVVASTNVYDGDLSESMFTQSETVSSPQKGAVVRMWRKPHPSRYEPRLTYWRDAAGGNGRLRIEFSMSKLMGGINVYKESDVREALYEVDAFLAGWMINVPSVSNMLCSRVDYAWNFAPNGDVPAYIAALQGLWLGRMSRHPHPDAEGVVWKSRESSYRWVKFYNKTREAGSEGTPVLRFEVSNYHKALSYMCKNWFDCARTVDEVLQPGRALYVLARMWYKLGVDHLSGGEDEALLLRLRSLFGRGAAGAYYALACIRAYGKDTHSVYHLMSDNSYYKWLSTLTDHGLLSESVYSLLPLSLPIAEVINESIKQASQDLSFRSASPAVLFDKNFPKNWPFYAYLFKLAEKSPEIQGFTRDLERVYAETYVMGRVHEASQRSHAENDLAYSAAGTGVYSG